MARRRMGRSTATTRSDRTAGSRTGVDRPDMTRPETSGVRRRDPARTRQTPPATASWRARRRRPSRPRRSRFHSPRCDEVAQRERDRADPRPWDEQSVERRDGPEVDPQEESRSELKHEAADQIHRTDAAEEDPQGEGELEREDQPGENAAEAEVLREPEPRGRLLLQQIELQGPAVRPGEPRCS